MVLVLLFRSFFFSEELYDLLSQVNKNKPHHFLHARYTAHSKGTRSKQILRFPKGPFFLQHHVRRLVVSTEAFWSGFSWHAFYKSILFLLPQNHTKTHSFWRTPFHEILKYLRLRHLNGEELGEYHRASISELLGRSFKPRHCHSHTKDLKNENN